MDLPDSVIGEAYRFGAWDTVAALTDIGNRMAGSEGEQAAMETLADALRDAGAREVGIERFEFPGWERGKSSLSLSERRYDHQHQLLALPGGPSGAVTAPVVDVGHGTPAEFEAADVAGALALASSATPEDHDRWLHRREKYSFAVEAGAAGFLFRNHVPGNLPPTGDVGERDGPGAIPAAGISRELGERLVRRCAREDDLEATLRVDCRSEQMESGNVSGRLGPVTGETVLVTAHHDAHDIAEGARDNGAGCALVVQLARMLAAVEADLETTVRFVTFGAEEVGLRGSRQFVARADLSDVRAVVNCDAVGKSRDLAVHTNGFEGLPDPFEAGADDVGVPVTIREEIAPHSDHWPFVRQGVPGVMAASSGGDDRGWGHTHGDTLDKLDRRDLRELAVPLASAVLDIATGDPPADHVDPETIERRAEQEGHVLEDPN